MTLQAIFYFLLLDTLKIINIRQGGFMSNAKKGNSKNTSKNNETKKDLSLPEELEKVKNEIIEESIKITKNEISSCYGLVMKTKRLLELRLMENK